MKTAVAMCIAIFLMILVTIFITYIYCLTHPLPTPVNSEYLIIGGCHVGGTIFNDEIIVIAPPPYQSEIFLRKNIVNGCVLLRKREI